MSRFRVAYDPKILFIAACIVVTFLTAFLIIGANENRIARECAAAHIDTKLPTRVNKNGACEIEVTQGAWFGLDVYRMVEEMR